MLAGSMQYHLTDLKDLTMISLVLIMTVSDEDAPLTAHLIVMMFQCKAETASCLVVQETKKPQEGK